MTTSSATKAVRAGIASDTQHGAVIPPLHLSSNFTFSGYNQPRPYDYTRSGNPTRDLLASALAELEGGVGAVVTSTGMSAIALVLHTLSPGDLVLAPHDCYGGTWRLLDALQAKGLFRLSFIDQRDPDALAIGMAQRPKMVWIETPSNPLLRITDIRRVAKAARSVGATVVVDNTFLSPVLQQPLALGAHLVVHSTTKYINGHSDVVGGAVIAGDAALAENMTWWANCLGITGAPHDSFLALRGLRTLHVRMRQHLENTAAIVDLLCRHEAVARVHHPSLPDHPGYELALGQQSGFGAMVSFELKGREAQVKLFLEDLAHFSLAESLGGVESLVAHPATMTHAAMDVEARSRAGIGAGLLRLSVGIESASDLTNSLRKNLDRVAASLSASDTAATRDLSASLI